MAIKFIGDGKIQVRPPEVTLFRNKDKFSRNLNNLILHQISYGITI